LPAMILSRIPDLPAHLTSTYRRLFWRDELARFGPPIRLLRLYLGRTLPGTSHHLAPGVQSEFPLDQTRYRMLDEALRAEGGAGLPDFSEVCRSMGEVLGKLHWEVGTNGRDIELVLGGDGSEGVQCYVLDYNQVSRDIIILGWELITSPGHGLSRTSSTSHRKINSLRSLRSGRTPPARS
jgi:hypothetical protein